MSESIPLSSGLGVHGVQIVVGDTGGDGFDRVLEWLAAEGGHLRYVQR